MVDVKAQTGIIGNQTVQSLDQYLGGALQCCEFQFTGSTGQYTGTLNVYFSKIDWNSNYAKAVFGIYDAMGNRIAKSAEKSGLKVGWNSQVLDGSFSLTNGARYRLAFHCPAGNGATAWRMGWSGIAQHGWKARAYDGTLPSTLTAISANSLIGSIYASLQPVGGQVVQQTASALTYSPSNVNLADIPYDWYLTYGSGKQIIFLDSNIVRTPGKPSIRLEPHTAGDVNTARECDGAWYSVKPGDHVVAKCWIKMDPNYVYTGTDPAQYNGGRLGMDLYGPNGAGGITILDGYPHSGAEHIASEVNWGTVGWTLRTWDIIIPSTIYTKDARGNSIPATPITSMVLWLDVRPVTATGLVWFADAELYINPT